MMISLCACGTTEKQVIKDEALNRENSSESITTYTEKWLLTKATTYKGTSSEVVTTFTYDEFGNVSAVLRTEPQTGVWYKLKIKDNKLEKVESNVREVYFEKGIATDITISLESDYEYSFKFYRDGGCYKKVTHTINNGRIVKINYIDYNTEYSGEIIRTGEQVRTYNENNAITSKTYVWFDHDTDEVIEQGTESYYCDYDSNQLPIAVYNSDDYSSDSPKSIEEYVWNLVEVKK